jgi:putative acetyltransferase
VVALVVVMGLCVPKRLFARGPLIAVSAAMVAVGAVAALALRSLADGLAVYLLLAAAIQLAVVVMTGAGIRGPSYLTEGRLTKTGSGLLHLGFIVFALVVVALQSSPLMMPIFALAGLLIAVGMALSFYAWRFAWHRAGTEREVAFDWTEPGKAVLIREERQEDVEDISRVLLACFPTPAEASLVEQLRESELLTLSLVAVVDAKIVGHVAFSPVTVASGSTGVGLAPLAVLPAHRGTGIASQLVRRGLDEWRARGCGWAVVLGDPEYYARFGFQPASEFGLMDDLGGGAAFQALELADGELPVGAGLVSYAPEFASL